MENSLNGIIESVLFAAGESVDADKLAEIAEVGEQQVYDAVNAINQEYTANRRGFSIIEIDGGYQICTRPEYYPHVQAIAGIKRQQGLSSAALEALSIIAYNEPITRGTIEYVRGVNSDGAVARLVERGLVEEKGRANAPGKPILYATTSEFLRCFGLKSLDELPEFNVELDLEEEQLDQMRIDV